MSKKIDTARGVVVWLHGMGEEPATMLEVATSSKLDEIGVRSIALKAQGCHFSKITGEFVSAWFDQEIAHLEISNENEIKKAVKGVDEYIDSFIEMHNDTKLVIAGFSQGAVVALIELLSHPNKFVAALLYSPYRVGFDLLHYSGVLEGNQCTRAQELPCVWIGYGLHDWIIPARWSYSLALELRNLGFNVTVRHYSGGHTPFGGAHDDIRDFLTSSI